MVATNRPRASSSSAIVSRPIEPAAGGAVGGQRHPPRLAAAAAARQGEDVGLDADGLQRRDAGGDGGARQDHQLHLDAARLTVAFEHVDVVMDRVGGERRQPVHLEGHHLAQVLLGRRRQVDDLAQGEFVRQPQADPHPVEIEVARARGAAPLSPLPDRRRRSRSCRGRAPPPPVRRRSTSRGPIRSSSSSSTRRHQQAHQPLAAACAFSSPNHQAKKPSVSPLALASALFNRNRSYPGRCGRTALQSLPETARRASKLDAVASS